jgi:hypothetical protein
MRDINSLSQFPYQVVAERPDDDLPCACCEDYGAILIVEIRGSTYDICHRCAARAGIKW